MLAVKNCSSFGELQIRAATQRRLGIAPLIVALPVGVLKLVLDVEQPDADRARQQRRWRPHDKEVLPADQPAQRGDDDGQRGVGAEHAVAHPRSCAAAHQPRFDDHGEHRAEPEHHQRVTKQPVGKPTPPRTSLILGDRQGLDIALRRGGRDPQRWRGARRAQGATDKKARARATRGPCPTQVFARLEGSSEPCVQS